MTEINIQIKESDINKIIEHLAEASDTWIQYDENPLVNANRCIKSMKHNIDEAIKVLHNYEPVSKPPHPLSNNEERDRELLAKAERESF